MTVGEDPATNNDATSKTTAPRKRSASPTPKNKNDEKRFKRTTEAEMGQLLGSVESMNTKRNTKYAVTLFKSKKKKIT